MRLVEDVNASIIHFQPASLACSPDPVRQRRSQRIAAYKRLRSILQDRAELRTRFERVNAFAKTIRSSEYHLTNACNIRCEGCWFFKYEHDKETREVKDLNVLRQFLEKERDVRRINSALVIGGEPALFLDRLQIFRSTLRYLTVSTNGYTPIPVKGFEDITIGITLFGGGSLDDQLRAILPGGKRFTGLFEKALRNYQADRRAGFVFALDPRGIEYVESTVRRIHENGNLVNFNCYNAHSPDGSADAGQARELLEEALRVAARYPDTVISHPYYIRAMLSGQTPWGTFGYDSCPSISVDHPAHRARLRNANACLPMFNTWAPDLKTLKFCCTSGHCDGCRDSQAVFSWLLVQPEQFFEDVDSLTTWIEIAESYWRQFIWSPYHPSHQKDDDQG